MVLAGVDFRECERLPHDTHFFDDMRRRKPCGLPGEGRASIHFPFLYSTPNPFSLCLITHSLDNVGGKCYNVNCMVTTTINSYTSNIMAGVLEFIGPHLDIIVSSFTIIFSFSILFSFFISLPRLAAGTKRKRKRKAKLIRAYHIACV